MSNERFHWTTLTLALTLVFLPAVARGGECGDCNGDGTIDIVDALEAAQHGASPWINGPRLLECDVDHSGDVDILDALAIARVAAGFPNTLDCVACGDCDLNRMEMEAGDLAALTGMIRTVVTTSRQAACDTNGDGVIDFRDQAEFSNGFRCTQCGDCDQDGSVTLADANFSLAFPHPPGDRAYAACDVAPMPLTILDSLQIAAYTQSAVSDLVCADSLVSSPRPWIQRRPGAYCISGTSNGTSFRMLVNAPGGSFHLTAFLTVPFGGGPGNFAQEIVDDVNTSFNFTAATVGDCFGIQALSGATPVTLTVFDPPNSCNIDAAGSAGCTFNPDIVADPLEGDHDGDGLDDYNELFGPTDPEDPDTDDDGVDDGADNCPVDGNPKQEDGDKDGVGDACEGPHPPDARDDFFAGVANQAVVIDVLANDFDVDDDLDPASLSFVDEPKNGVLIDDDGVLIYKPDEGFVGTDSFGYKVCDANGSCDDGFVGVAILPDGSNGGK